MARLPSSPFVVMFGLGVTVSACGSTVETQAPRERIDFVLGPRTKQLTARELEALDANADRSQTLRFTAGAADRFVRGDVILSTGNAKTPRGLLRIVRAVKTEGDTTQVETEQAPLQLAFQKLNVHLERTLDMPATPPAPLQSQGGFKVGGTTPIDHYVYKGDDDPSTVTDQLRLIDAYSGEFGVTLDINFDWGFAQALVDGIDGFLDCIATAGLACSALKLPTLEAKFEAGVRVAAKFDHAGGASAGYKLEFLVGEQKQLDPIQIGPLTFVPTVGFTGSTEGKASSYARLAGRAETGFTAKAAVSTSTGLTTSFEAPNQYNIDAVESYLDANTTTAVGPTLEMLAYGAIGPTFGVEFKTELDVDRQRSQDCYRAAVGVNARFGFRVRFPWKQIGKYLSQSESVGESVEDIARYFGLAGDILNKSVSFPVATQQVAQGVCALPPEGELPPGAPQDTVLSNPPFTQWSKRFDEPGIHFAFSTAPHNARAQLSLGVDGHMWALAAPSPTLQRVAIDGRHLRATRYIGKDPITERDWPLPISGFFEREDLFKWVLFENGVVARLAPDGALADAFTVRVPVSQAPEEVATLRHGVVRKDGRTALLFGIRQLQSSFDHRMVLVELDARGKVLRARAMGEATSNEFQSAFFTVGGLAYQSDGTLVLVGESTQGMLNELTKCFAFALKDDGALAFATTFAPIDTACAVGGLSIAQNDDVLFIGNTGRIFNNAGLLAVLDKGGVLKASATFNLGNSLVSPTAVTRLPTSGYLATGTNTLSATSMGAFIARLDGEGLALGVTQFLAPDNITLGSVDAFLTKDAGLLFVSHADWQDLAQQTDKTRWLFGKAYARDGSLPYAAASGMRTSTLAPSTARRMLVVTPMTRALSDVAVMLEPLRVPLREERITTVETTFAP